jgi:hypothetical protein
MIRVEELFDDQEIEAVKNDLIQECKTFGDIISIEIPKPLQSKPEGERLPGTC